MVVYRRSNLIRTTHMMKESMMAKTAREDTKLYSKDRDS